MEPGIFANDMPAAVSYSGTTEWNDSSILPSADVGVQSSNSSAGFLDTIKNYFSSSDNINKVIAAGKSYTDLKYGGGQTVPAVGRTPPYVAENTNPTPGDYLTKLFSKLAQFNGDVPINRAVTTSRGTNSTNAASFLTPTMMYVIGGALLLFFIIGARR